MAEIKCPKCGTTFKVDDDSYADILSQVRSAEFEKELHNRLSENTKQAEADKRLALAEQASKNEREIAKNSANLQKELSEQEREIAELQAKNAEVLADLRAQLAQSEIAQKLAVSEATAPIQQKLDKLKNELDTQVNRAKQNEETIKMQAKLREASLVSKYEGEMKFKDEEIERLKDMKVRLSTKMVGETLEQHCQTEFNRLRATAFKDAYFEKDNDARTGSKGDYIYRENDENCNEIISIMFEMKNENETTATKHKNEDFFKELDKDRKEKKCEYAVLVSMLERDNELYNAGIVNKSYLHDKMFVIRPQMFMIIISLLAQAARKNQQLISSLRHDLAIAQAQSVDITNFEERRDKFAEAFTKLVQGHAKKQADAIDTVDKVIATLEKQIDSLRKVKSLFDDSYKKLEKANTAIETDFTIKKLTRGNKTMQAMFRQAAEQAALQPPAESPAEQPTPETQE